LSKEDLDLLNHQMIYFSEILEIIFLSLNIL
jgi:hypothetical protein